VTIGILRPVILLPADAVSWPVERRALVLAHELAHVGRFDTLTQLMAQVAVALFWFDPLLWLAARRMGVEREFACDDAGLREGSAPSFRCKATPCLFWILRRMKCERARTRRGSLGSSLAATHECLSP
jgi:beta-lactamase regulating signal transducer with metallopeptidase domain